MSDVAIRVEGLSKRYKLGHRVRYRALRDTLAQAVAAPVRWIWATRDGVDGPSKDQNGIWSLKDVSFEVGRGEVVGIIGRNGAGKSTLLKILSRITEPTEGRAELRGRVGSLLEVGTGFHPELTGRENVYLNGAILGMRRVEIHRKFDEIVAFAEVEQFLDTPVKHYSSGMHVRLAFAVAAHLEPEILLVDEVLAVGDTGFQKKCLGKMGEVAKSGRTVLFVSHNMAAVQSLCKQALLLDQGQVVSQGPSDIVAEDYLRRVSGQHFRASSDLQSLPREHGMRKILVEGHVNREPLVGEHTFLPEEDLTFALDLDLPQAMRQCTAGIHFEDELGIRVLAANTGWQLGRIDLAAGRHHLVCTIRKSPLVPGRYYISLGFSSAAQQTDWLDRIACIEFLRCDVYGTGELPAAQQGYFLSRPEWTIRPDGLSGPP